MINDELKDYGLVDKLNYLNGFLMALSFVNSYSVVGMNYKLFHFKLNDDLKKTIQENSFNLFGVYPNEWDIELIEEKNWQQKLKNELFSNFERRIPHNAVELQPQYDYKENDLVKDLTYQIKLSLSYFVDMIYDEFARKSTHIFELKVTKGSFYRLVGIDLIFQIDETDIIFLQLYGAD